MRYTSYYCSMDETWALWGSRFSATVALALYVVGLVGAFGVRTWLHWRRTGDSGFRRKPADRWLGRMGMILFGVALLLCGAGLVMVLVAPGLRWNTPQAITWLGLLVCVGGLVAVLASQSAMGTSWRVGVDPQETTELVTSGIFAVVRNPIFTAMGITLVGVVLMVPTVVTILALVAYCVGVQLQVRLVEEPYLARLHGDDYRGYASRVGRFIPGLR